MRNFFIGILIGIGKIIPGVSGSIIAIRFNVYEKMIDSIIHFFSDIKNNTKFLSAIFFGIILSIILSSKLILYLLDNFYLITISIFVILIASGIPSIYKKSNNIYISIITFILSFILINLPILNFNIGFFIMGIIEAISMIIPGISGTAIYMSLGVYDKMLSLFIKIQPINTILFIFGLAISSLIVIKIINYCFSKYKKETYSAILGFQLSSLILMIIN